MAKDKPTAGQYVPPTAEQIAAWKEQYPQGVYHIPVEGKECYMHFPDLRQFKFAIQEARKSAMGFNRVIIENCWLDGDPEIKSDDRYYLALCSAMDEIVNIPDATVERRQDSKLGIVHDITIEGMTCTLKTPTRDNIDVASRNNKNPLDKSIKLVEILWVDGDKKIKQRNDCYAALLSCMDDITEKKTALVKKL